MAVPGELTTMAGRRVRETVAGSLQPLGDDIVPVIAGLSNTYTHYVTTFEEYQKQRYEAASTIYGPNTLLAYQQQFSKLAVALKVGEELPAGTPPDDLLGAQISFVPGVVYDQPPAGSDFGDCVVEPEDARPGDRVTATFISGHLRNNLMLEKTFLRVELEEGQGEYRIVAVDSDWETKLQWLRTNSILGSSEVYVLKIYHYILKIFNF